jgi:DNA-binding MarR family transcriptional regulator
MSADQPPIAPLLIELHGTLVEELHAALPNAGFPDVRPRQCQVLGSIEPGGSRLTDLAAAVGMTKQSMVTLVDQLEASGYVERARDRSDARAKAIRLTPKGRHAVRAIGELGARLEEEWAAKIGHRRLSQLREALAGIGAD